MLLRIVLLVLALASAEMVSACSREEAYAAEAATDYLNNWDNVYIFYRQFFKCYDASIAEGAADQIEKLWAEKWETLPILLQLTEKDPGFKTFIWARIGEEIFPHARFDVVLSLAKTKCPKEGAEFCAAVIRAAPVR